LTLREPGLAEIEKSPVAGEFTTSVTPVEWLSEPLTPVIVSGYDPGGVVEGSVVIVSVEPPLPPVIGAGANVPPAPAGNPETLSATSPVNPPDGVTVTL
jgi:hypothetical protein